MLENHIEQLTKELELEGSLASEIPGVFAFPLEENLSISISGHSAGFALSCTLCPAPKINQEAFLTRVMLGNLFGQGTRGAVLGLNEDGSQLTLAQVVDYNADYKEFRDVLEDFINSVDFWRAEAEKYNK